MKKEAGILISIAVIAIGIIVGVMISNSNTSSNSSKLLWRDDAPMTGATNPKVKVVEFGDFQCPACGYVAPAVRNILAANKDTVQLEFRHYPLTQIHNNAMNAAIAAEITKKYGKFWEMDKILYDNQSSWSDKSNTADIFAGFATLIGMDETKFRQDWSNQQPYIDSINNDKAAGDAAGIQGTPTFFINGSEYKGNLSEVDLKAAIEAATR